MTVVAPCAKKIQLHSEDWRAAEELGLRIRTSCDPRPQPPLWGRASKTGFSRALHGDQCRAGGRQHGQFPPPRSPKQLDNDSQPEVVERRKSHRQEGVRTRATTGSGRGHAAGKEDRSEGSSYRPTCGSWNVIEPSAAKKSTASTIQAIPS